MRRSVARAALLADRVGVQVVDAQLGHHVRVQHDLPAAPDFCTMTSGTMMLASARLNGRPGFGSSATISACASRSSSSSAPVTAHQPLQVAPGQQRQVVLADDDRDHLRLAARLGAQLQRQAFGQVACADAGRLHALQEAQRAAQTRQQLVVRLVGLVVDTLRAGLPAQLRGDLLERIGQIAVLVQRLDQHHHGGRVELVEAQVRQLRAQVVLERDRRRVAVALVELVAVVDGARLARRLADAVEVLALGAVFPVVAVGRAEFGAVDRLRLVARRRSRTRRRARSRARLRARRSSCARPSARSPASCLPRLRGRGSARASARLPGAARGSRAAAAGSTAAAAASARGAARGRS